MTQVKKTIPTELDIDSHYSVKIRSINSFGVPSDWSEALIVNTNIGFRKIVQTDDSLTIYRDDGDTAFSYNEVNRQRINYVTNPSFEVDTTGWIALSGSPVSVTSFLTGLFGNKSLSVNGVNNSLAGNDGVVKQTNATAQAILPDQFYCASAFIKPWATGKNFYIKVDFYNSSFVSVGVNTSATITSSSLDWLRLDMNGKAPANSVWAIISIICPHKMMVGQYFRVDGVLFEKGTAELGPYFDGSTAAGLTTWSGVPHGSSSTFQSETSSFYLSNELTIGGMGRLIITKTGSVDPIMLFDATAGLMKIKGGVDFSLYSADNIPVFTIDGSTGEFISKGSASISGNLTLLNSPVLDAHAATKGYVDTHVYTPDIFTAVSQDAMLALLATPGDYAIRSDVDKTFILKNEPPTVLANWIEMPTAGSGGTAVALHEAAADPHPQYMTLAESDSLYRDASYLNVGTLNADRLPGTINAHTTGTAASWTTARTLNLAGDLSGFVSIKGDVTMTLTATVIDDSHIHDTRYYTETESDSRFVKIAGDTMSGDLTVPNMIISGNLTVNGSTTTINSTIVSIDDPIFTLGGDTAPTTDDNKDRGIEFRYHDGTSARKGFFGFDDSTGKFAFLVLATNLNEIFTGTRGEIDAFVDWSNILNKSIILGTNTDGNYVGGLTGTANQIIISGINDEGSVRQFSLPQNIHTSATPTFTSLTLSQAIGLAPFTVTSTTKVVNLNSDLLDNYDAGYFAPLSLLESVLGDLLFVGLFNASAYLPDVPGYFHIPKTDNNFLTIPRTTAIDATIDYRCDVIVPPDPVANTSYRTATEYPFYMFWYKASGIIYLYNEISATDATYPAVYVSIASQTGFPAIGARVQLRTVWDSATDTLYLYWRAGTADLTSNTGWTLATSSVFTGKQISQVATWYIGGTVANNAFNSNIYRVLLYQNNSLLIDLNGPANIVNNTNTTVTATTGQIATIYRTPTLGYIDLPGTNSNYLSTPDAAALDITGDICIVAKIAPDDWTPAAAQMIAAKTAISNQYSWFWYINTLGQLVLQSSSNGTALVTRTSTANLSALADGSVKWVAVTLDVDNGASGNNTLFWTSDDGITWTQLGTTVTVAGITSIFSGTSQVDIGSYVFGNAPFGGNIYDVSIRNGIGASGAVGGTEVFGIRQGDIPANTANSFTATTGQTVTVERSGTPATTLYPLEVTQLVPTDRHTMPTPIWFGGGSVYRHGMYWIASSEGDTDFIDADLSGRYVVGVDAHVELYRGDWIICIDPNIAINGAGVDLTLSQVTFQYIPFSTETYVKSQIALHVDPVTSPDPHAQYLTIMRANPLYSGIQHTHADAINDAINTHKLELDPHPIYSTLDENNALYSLTQHLHPYYEPLGAVEAHVAGPNPHNQYIFKSTAYLDFASKIHAHSEYATLNHIHQELFEIHSTDGAASADVWIGSTEPTAVDGLGIGDMWIESTNISLQVPSIVSGFTLVAPNGHQVDITWNDWHPSEAVNEIELQVLSGGTWTTILSDAVAPFPTSFAHTTQGGVTVIENTAYSYRLRAKNASLLGSPVGWGPYNTKSITTLNDPPASPTGVVLSAPSSSSISLTWTDVAGLTYDVYLNGTFDQNVADPPVVKTGRIENTAYTMGVRAQDAQGAVSAIVTGTVTTPNAAPPAPTGLVFVSKTHNSITVSWNAVTGINDLKDYIPKIGATDQAAQTTTSKTFTGLSGSTAYSIYVKTRDLSLAVSAYTAALSVTTNVNPDSTPPATATLTSFKPESVYGRMYARFTCPADADFAYYRVDRAYGSVAWTDMTGWVAASPNAVIAINLGDFGAGNTIYARVWVKDTTGNYQYSDFPAYTLITSPTYISADATNQWRNTNGGQYNGTQNSRPYQGYYDTASFNAIGMWYYGTKIQDTLSYGGRRTIISGTITLKREAAGGSAGVYPIVLLHNQTTNPGSIANVAAPTLFGTATQLSTALTTPAVGGPAVAMALPTQWVIDMVGGYNKGVCVYDADGQPYAAYSNVSDYADTGRLIISHLG